MSGSHRKTGVQGEQLARNYLLKQDYQIITTNWRCSAGEIDIIARKADTLVFVEVRTRSTSSTQDAFASVSPRKQQRMIDAAHTYINSLPPDQTNMAWRIDVIGIALDGNTPKIDHVEDALDW